MILCKNYVFYGNKGEIGFSILSKFVFKFDSYI